MTAAILLALAMAAAPPSDELAVVSGQVVDQQTGEPLRKTNLALQTSSGRDRKTYATRSDAAGQYVFRDVEPGSYRLSAERFGYLRQQYNPRDDSAGVTLQLRAGQQLTGLRFELIPQGVITGRVLDEDGDPLQRVSVMLLRYQYSSGRRTLVPATHAMTNDIGEYRLGQVPRGRYYVRAARSYRGRTELVDGLGYTPTFYPQADDPSTASPVAVKAGQHIQGVDIRLEQARMFSVRGVVVDGTSNNPVEGIPVSLGPAGAGWVSSITRRSATSREGGRFELSQVPTGDYVLTTSGRSRRRRSSESAGVARQPLVVGEGGVDGVTLVLRPPQLIEGTVEVEDDEQMELRGMRVGFTAAGTIGEHGTQLTDENSFRIGGLLPERYFLNVRRLPEGAYLKSATLERADILENGIDLSTGVPGAAGSTLSAKGAGVVGKGTDSEDAPAGGVLVTLVPEGESVQPGYL
ncbi:MAG: carboxypeptidase regulatory-like domain-containing protein, partial [bacterium]|nr:carboxypeptidase regulatory-like domain-containing protein [bacterium]